MGYQKSAQKMMKKQLCDTIWENPSKSGRASCRPLIIEKQTTNKEEILSKSRGKVVTDNNNNIMYCSRNIIPSNKQNTIIENYEYKIHVGIFVYDKKYLLDYFCKENTVNQLLEDIEWLKIIEQGFTINTILSDEMERGIDTIEDYNYLKNNYEKNKIINI